MKSEQVNCSTPRTLMNKLILVNNEGIILNDYIIRNVGSNEWITLGFLNQYGFNLACKSTEDLKSFCGLDVILRDGIGIKLALKFLGIEAGTNLNGTDLIPKIVNATKSNNPNYIVLGTESPWLEKGSKKLFGNDDFKVLDGFKEYEEYLVFLKETVDSTKYNVVILAMGMPKQEVLAERIKREIKANGVVVCGGAIIDFQAGRFKRAPVWMRKLSLEWLYRLLKEPKRLFNRYVIGIPVFFYNLLLWFGFKR